MDPKIELNNLIESEFKRYVDNKVYISNFATGGGKSYNIAKLTCTYYPKHFGQIVILCVQNKLVLNMKGELSKFYGDSDCLVSQENVLLVESNAKVLANAVRNNSIRRLYGEIEQYVEKEELYFKLSILNELKVNIKNVEQKILNVPENEFDKLSENKDFSELEFKIRKAIKDLILLVPGGRTNNSKILNLFPSLIDVYPQINIRKAKVVLLTVHKALMGIDLILEKEISLVGFENKSGTLFIFDESDQAALSMRNVIITQSLRENIDLYRDFTTYQSLLEESSISEDFPQKDLLMNNKSKAQETLRKRFYKKMGIDRMPNNILLKRKEIIDSSKNGVFICGPTLIYNIKHKDVNPCHVMIPKVANHLTMSSFIEEKNSKEKCVVLSDFVVLLSNSIRTIKASLTNVVKTIKKDQMKVYNDSIKNEEAQNTNYPTDENCVHTLTKRFRNVEYEIEKQLNDFLKTPRNIRTHRGKSVEDTSVYMQGMQLYNVSVDDQDLLKSVSFYGHEILTTPEKIIYQLISKDNNTVVLSSATANSDSVASNFSIQHLKYMLRGKIDRTEVDRHIQFENYLGHLYHKDYYVNTSKINGYKFSDSRIEKWEMPDIYSNMFCKEALDEGLDKKWFQITKSILKTQCTGKKDSESINQILFQINRLFKFMESYHKFWHNNDIHSMIYFQNKSGKDDFNRKQIMLLSSLIDGSYLSNEVKLDSLDLPEIVNSNVLISNDTKEVKNKIENTIGKDPGAKLFLVTAYNSFKAGENLQYKYPEGLPVLVGDSWTEVNEKDWDAIYLEEPTHYFTITRDKTSDSENQKYLSLLNLMMFYEDGKICLKEVFSYLDAILKNQQVYVRIGDNPAMAKDKAKWMLVILEQAVGRLCRTKNKNNVTHIFYDEGVAKYFQYYDKKKSYTKEFRQLIEDVLRDNKDLDSTWDLAELAERINLAQKANMELNRINTKALWYNFRDREMDFVDSDGSDFDENASFRGDVDVEKYQDILDDFKQIILKNPTLDSIDILENENIGINIEQCYGEWKTDKKRQGYDYWRTEKKISVKGNDSILYRITPEDVRLDIMMKNPIIKTHFEKSGFATCWKCEHSYILHPNILQSWYAGEIGEQAFLALIKQEIGIDFVRLKGKDYELADFVIKDKNGKNLIAYDVKNYNPDFVHVDNINDVDTPEKRQYKRERLGCRVVTVNILEIEGLQNTSDEIGGLIDKNGIVINENLEIIINQIKSIL